MLQPKHLYLIHGRYMSPEFESDAESLVPSGPNAKMQVVRVVRTYLSLPSFGHLRRERAPKALVRLVRLAPHATDEWRRLYRDIGGPYHWHDRDTWSDTALAQHLASESVRAFRVQVLLPDAAVHSAGFLELELANDGSAEIAYLGLHQRVHGLGLGKWLVTEAVDEVRRMGATSVWLHTCTLDGPAALPNYLARGFTATRSEEYDARVPT
ncbi:MAG: GNAT family N-acetyltransferase [Gemmatimonas sp.]